MATAAASPWDSFGGALAGTSTPPPPAASGSAWDTFGGTAAPAFPDIGENYPKTPVGRVIGGVSAAGKAIASEAASLGDMLLSTPYQALGVMANSVRRAGGALTGEARKAQGVAGKELQDKIQALDPGLFKKLLNYLPQPKGEEAGSGGTSHTEQGINTLMEWTDRDAASIEERSKGAIKKEDVQLFRDALLTAVGAKAVGAPAKAAGKVLADKAGAKPFNVPEEPVIPPRPVGNPKADIERVTGIKDLRQRDAARKQIRSEVRAAFKDDAAYADYWQNWVEEEARQAQNAATRVDRTKAADGVVAPRTGSPAAQILSEPGRIDEGVVGQRSLDTGLAKVAQGQSFRLSAPEKIAIRDNAKNWGGKIEKGQIDQDLLNIGALAGTGAALAAAYPDEAKDLATSALAGGLFFSGGLERIGKMPDASPLAALLKESTTTLKTLERLPQNASVLPKRTIEEQLRRDDVTKAEKDILLEVLKASLGDTISPKDLVKGFQERTGDFQLEKEASEEFASYGLDAIIDINQLHDNGGGTATHVWRLPEGVIDSPNNHFQDPRYFGHTRAFWEGDTRHVVEIQSDLAQKAGKTLTFEERNKLDLELQKLLKEQAISRPRRLDGGTIEPVTREWFDRDVKIEEIKAKLRESVTTARAEPLFKNWYKRLVREELTDGTKNGEAKIRFATADTVAKVEGWPDHQENRARDVANMEAMVESIERGHRGMDGPETQLEKARLEQRLEDLRAQQREMLHLPRFRPEHQGIYDRYQKDIEKFIKQLGGKEHTDSAGHTWLEVPIKPDFHRTQMFGGAKTDVMLGIAAVSLGAAVGMNLDKDDPVVGAVLGALAGGAVKIGAIPAALRAIKAVGQKDTRIRIDPLTEQRQYAEQAGARAVAQAQGQIIKLVPKEERRVAINKAIDEGKVGSLSGNELKAARLVEDFYAGIAKDAQDAKVLKTARENYTTHLWDFSEKNKGIFEQLMAEKLKTGAGMSPNSRFAKQRSYVTMEEGKAAGLTPVTEDVAAIMGLYGNSMVRSIANRKLMDGLKAMKKGNLPLVLPAKGAPKSYVSIDSPQFQGSMVHPDIAPSLRFMYEAQSPGKIMAAVEGLNTALKRNAVSFSLFHAKALADAALGAVANPLTVGKLVAQAAAPRLFGENIYLKQFREGGAGDLVDHSFKDGLTFSAKGAESVVEDVGGGFYNGMKVIEKAFNKAVPGTGLAVKGYTKLNHALDNFMWGRLHAGMKLSVYAAKVEALMENTAKTGKPLTRDQAGKMAASYTNDVFGGLNWQRVAEGVQSKFARDIALELASPRGRRATQLLLFAPDWTLSTARAFTQAFRKGGGVMGIVSPKTLADLHRQQLLRSALYYVAVGDAINYAKSGHHIWDNKDWTRVELGDGRSMQLSKHFAEPFHWMMHPRQQALNKLGTLPKEAATQALGTEYLSAGGRAPPMKSHAGHLAGAVSPIGMQQFRDGGAAAGVSGALGVPIYGQTKEERRRKRLEGALKRYQQTHGGQGQ